MPPSNPESSDQPEDNGSLGGGKGCRARCYLAGPMSLKLVPKPKAEPPTEGHGLSWAWNVLWEAEHSPGHTKHKPWRRQPVPEPPAPWAVSYQGNRESKGKTACQGCLFSHLESQILASGKPPASWAPQRQCRSIRLLREGMFKREACEASVGWGPGRGCGHRTEGFHWLGSLYPSQRRGLLPELCYLSGPRGLFLHGESTGTRPREWTVAAREEGEEGVGWKRGALRAPPSWGTALLGDPAGTW